MAYIEREVEKEIGKWLDSREIVAMRGPRQCGKTTLLMRIAEMLKSRGVDESRIHYTNFEDDLAKMKFEENPKEFIEFSMTTGGKNYFLLDEVQYLKNAGKQLKLVFDSFSNAKIFVTGSASFDLTDMGKYLVGRIIFLDIHPFSFLEFLRAKNRKYEELYSKLRISLRDKRVRLTKTVFLDDLNNLLHEYLTYGSYPRVVTEHDRNRKKELLKGLFITYIEKDIVGLYGKQYREKVVRLLKACAYSMGNIVNYETLSRNAGLSYHDVRNIMPLLEDSFVIFAVRPFYRNKMNELRKNPKIYFVDFGMRNHIMEAFDKIDFSVLYENFVHNELKRLFSVKYWRTTAKTEVDFVIEHGREIIPVEVKTQAKVTRSFRSFIESYSPGKAFILNLTEIGKKRVNGCKVVIAPFAYI
ncbi:MAG: ATP-binding protein [Candidatus Aenigmarchaeota archaeon]|nr:ATP-binding protein [Candidatus Aenigmarchaeota archaeon]